MNKNDKLKIRNDSLYKKYNNLIIPNKYENKINSNDYYCPSCFLETEKKSPTEHSGKLGWPVDRDYLDNNGKNLKLKFDRYENANIAFSILTGKLNQNNQISDYYYSPLFTEEYKITDNLIESISKYHILENKMLKKVYDFEENIIRNNGILYNIKTNKIILYGNIWIKLQGSRECDFSVSDEFARKIGLFTNKRPKDYTWHHVYMGWINLNSSKDILKLSTFRSKWNGKSTGQILMDIGNSIIYNLSDKIYDATQWQNLWNPMKDLCLMQLVHRSIHEYCGVHYGSVHQYHDFYDNNKFYDKDDNLRKGYC